MYIHLVERIWESTTANGCAKNLRKKFPVFVVPFKLLYIPRSTCNISLMFMSISILLYLCRCAHVLAFKK